MCQSPQFSQFAQRTQISTFVVGASLARVIKPFPVGREVSTVATDDSGLAFEAVALPIGANETVDFNSDDLEVPFAGWRAGREVGTKR